VRLAGEEDERIVAALAKQVDWSTAPAAEGVALTATMRRLGEGPVVAGEQFQVRVEVKNNGSTPVERVHGITDCVHDELDGIEVLVGKVAPGETVVRDLQLYVMSWHSDFADVLALDVHAGEPDTKADARAEVRLDVEGRPKPSLSYSWWIVDDPALVAAAPSRPQVQLLEGEAPFTVKGNGDGMLQAGERVLLAFAARNDGPGTSPDVRAILRNESPQQGLLEEGALSLGELRPGQGVRGAFGITVNDTADVELPFEVELMMGDELRLRVLPDALALKEAAGSVRVEGEPLRIYNGAHASAPVVLELPVGTEVATVGQLGAWRVLDVRGQGRRLFVPADLGVAGGKLAGKPKVDPLAALEREPLVLPPGLVIDEVPRVVKDDHITLRATATHPRWVRDVAVLVRPPGVSQIDQKVHYAANPASQGAQAQSLAFEVEVPLEPGGNRITILVRDGRKVERTEDVWVFREKAG
jgi:carboxyl-terminal processing protease